MVAARLSEDPAIRVLVLEAGDDDARYPDIAVPGNARGLWGSSASWDDYTVPQNKACLGMKNNVSFLRISINGIFSSQDIFGDK